jgi:metal-responsive CopG/Arc/MetJ family transcriptional regulator
MARVTIRLPDELDDEVEKHLEYDYTKSDFYREAAEEKLDRKDPDGQECSADA